MPATTDYEVVARCSDTTVGTPGTFKFTEHFINEPKKSEYDATLILGCRMNHDYGTPNQDVVNSWVWNGMTKKAKSIKRFWLQEIYVSSGQPSSLEDEYTEIQAAVGYADSGIELMPDLATEGIVGWMWTRNFLSTQGAWVGKQSTDGCIECGDVQNTVYMWWMSPKRYKYELLPGTMPLVFHHSSQNYGNVNPKEAYALFKLIMKVRFLGSERSERYGE